MNANSPVSSALTQALNDHLAVIRATILSRADELARDAVGEDSADPTTSIAIVHLSRAIEEYAPGRPVVPLAKKEEGIGRRLLDGISPITVISAALTVVFAGFGLFALSSKAPTGLGSGGNAYLDIAKIFAGAIVGSSSAAITSSLRRQPSANIAMHRPPERGRR
jgi:hypothetical protein